MSEERMRGFSAENPRFIERIAVGYEENCAKDAHHSGWECSDVRAYPAELITVDKKLEVERKEKEYLVRIKQGLTDLLLTGKIRVN